jgi:ApbE superfamily uncharacterized protein (UPF0280 family)
VNFGFVSNLWVKAATTDMSYEQYIGAIDDESVLAECGPMRLVIRAWNKKQPQIKLARRAAEKSILYLERIARCRAILRRPIPEILELPEDELALEMIASVRAVGDEDLTPMAAVAGTIADMVANWLFEREATKVIVDNGGDIAVRIAAGESVTVGVRPRVDSGHISHVIKLDSGRSAWGVTTSGVGGRSLTRGIASAVTVLATNASVADAAATAVANACFVDSANIRQIPAERLDPGTDLAGVPVTVGIGALSQPQLLDAFEKALHRADDLVARGIIFGALICQANLYTMTSSSKNFICRCFAGAGQAPAAHFNHPQISV